MTKDQLIAEFGEDYGKIFGDYQKAIKIKDKRLEESRSKLISIEILLRCGPTR